MFDNNHTLNKASVIPFSIKQKQSENLNDQVEKFLKNGGSVKEIPFGYSAFKDGIIPTDKSNTNAKKTDNDATIEAKNEAIRKQEEERKLADQQQMVLNREKQEKEKLKQERLIQSSQLKSINSPVDKANPPSKKTKAYKDPKETERRKLVRERRLEAVRKNEKTFMAPCFHHGETQYAIFNNGTRCVKCRNIRKNRDQSNKNKPPEFIEKKKRQEANHKSMMEAIAKGEFYFMADCINCGVTRFKAKKIKKRSGGESYHLHCIQCMTKSSRLSEEQRRVKRQQQKMLRLAREQEVLKQAKE